MGIRNHGLGWFFYMLPVGECISKRKRRCWRGWNGKRNGLSVFGREDIFEVNVDVCVLARTIGNIIWTAGKWLCLTQFFRL